MVGIFHGSDSLLYFPGSVVFPVDFFEHCSMMNDIEYGGNDLLQVYNVQQLKNRLNSQGVFVHIYAM